MGNGVESTMTILLVRSALGFMAVDFSAPKTILLARSALGLSMPSELMDSHGLSPSSFLSEEVQLPNERQIGFWKTDGMPDDYGPKDGKVYALGDSSLASLPLEKQTSSEPHMLKRFDVPNVYLNQDHKVHISLENNSVGAGRTIGHSIRRPLDNDRGNRVNVNMDHKSYLTSGNKFNVMGDHYENGLFSSSLSELFSRKCKFSPFSIPLFSLWFFQMQIYDPFPLSNLVHSAVRLSANNSMYGHSVGAAASHYEEEEPFESLEEIEAQTIGNLLPDDDDLLSGVTDGLDCKVQPGSGDDVEELDFFSSVGGMELGEDGGQRNYEISGGSSASQLGPSSGAMGEHPHGEHPSRTLFVRNINSNVEDSELRILFEQYGDIRTLYTACKHRGFVMISYYDIRAARSAMQALQNKPLRRRKLDIHYSIPKDNPSDKDINRGTVVIFNLDSTVSNDELHHIFGVYGEVKEIREAPQGSRHKSIEFYDIRAAEAALHELNKSDIGGKQLRLEPSQPGGSKRVNSPFPELDLDETSALLQMFSPPDFRTEISGPVSHVRVTPGCLDNETLLGLHSGTAPPATQLLDTEIQHGIPSSVSKSFSSIIGVESGGMPSSLLESAQLQNQLKYDFRSTSNYHPHSLPEYQDGLTNSILCNSPSSMAASLNCRMSERAGNRQFNRIGGSIGRSLELNDSGKRCLKFRVYFNSLSLSLLPVEGFVILRVKRDLWNGKGIYNRLLPPQPHNMMWPNSPSLINGVGNAHSAPLVHALPRAPAHVANTFLHINNQHVGSAPSVNPSIWDRRHSYAGESPDASVFHPGSLGNMRVPGNSLHPLDFVSHNIFPRMGGNSMDLPIPSKNIGLASHHQNNVMFPSRGQMIPMMSSFDSASDRARSRRNEGSSNQADNKKQFELDLDRIMRGEDRRTTLMIKNIPNKMKTDNALFFSIFSWQNKCNVGYAFINMTDPSLIIPFYQNSLKPQLQLQAFNGKKWEKFNSEKVASLAYARIQGKAALIAHFQNSSLMNEDKRCRPILFHTDGPNAGDQVPFPMGVNVRSRVNKNRNSTNEESSQDVGNGEVSSNGDSSSGSTKDFE
ncbi:Nucleotide-binding, alpha-beta plait [Cynara cardunculus var. scolymus]|uniref:Nucleotide-binding, alpha-beta plait n=1 Tax=Cynara cardunculus var. scolymus TaxID=59895 RepID=A0A124SAP9_CYNCS|nr:Nucleotide-binding, alpha-beta plait [Cynara cardunculus var. scolymus]